MYKDGKNSENVNEEKLKDLKDRNFGSDSSLSDDSEDDKDLGTKSTNSDFTNNQFLRMLQDLMSVHSGINDENKITAQKIRDNLKKDKENILKSLEILSEICKSANGIFEKVEVCGVYNDGMLFGVNLNGEYCKNIGGSEKLEKIDKTHFCFLDDVFNFFYRFGRIEDKDCKEIGTKNAMDFTSKAVLDFNGKVYKDYIQGNSDLERKFFYSGRCADDVTSEMNEIFSKFIFNKIEELKKEVVVEK